MAFSCTNCKHWLPIAEPGRKTRPQFGTCRRYPPVYVPSDTDDEPVWTNPPTSARYLCGEHLIMPDS